MSEQQQGETSENSVRLGLTYGVLAYGAWGLSPIYYKVLRHYTPEALVDPQINSVEVLAHRILWSVVVLFVWLALSGDLGAARVWRRPKLWAALAVTTVLIGLNWGTFVYAVAIGEVRSASLGYFINPLVSIVLGYIFLGERLRPLQMVSVALACLGVGYMTWANGSVPAIALILAFSFGFYGLLRKLVPVQARVGLLVEAAHLLPIALVAIYWLWREEKAAFATAGMSFDITLMFSGLVTVLPLLWFTLAAKRLQLATIGFMQYFAPSGQLLLAVLFFGEPFTRVSQVSFALIWLGLGLYTLDVYRSSRAAAATR